MASETGIYEANGLGADLDNFWYTGMGIRAQMDTNTSGLLNLNSMLNRINANVRFGPFIDSHGGCELQTRGRRFPLAVYTTQENQPSQGPTIPATTLRAALNQLEKQLQGREEF